MKVIFYLTLLLAATFARGNNSDTLREDDRDDDDRDGASAFATFDSPVYAPGSVKSSGPDGKSAYNTPIPALPASYAAYLAGLGYGNPYAYGAYNRFSGFPFTIPSAYGYGATLSNPAYASALLSGLGYSGYGGPYFGRSVYPGLGYGYSNYLSGLGYRYGGLGYPPAPLRGGPAPVANVPAPVLGTVPRAVSRVAPIPAPVATVPGQVYPSPVIRRAGDPTFFPYGPRPVQGKDGVARYAPDVPMY